MNFFNPGGLYERHCLPRSRLLFLVKLLSLPVFLRLHTSAVYFPFCHRDNTSFASLAFSTFLYLMRRLDDRVVGPLTYPWVCYVASQKSVRFRQLMPRSKLCDGFFSLLCFCVFWSCRMIPLFHFFVAANLFCLPDDCIITGPYFPWLLITRMKLIYYSLDL